MTVTLDQIKSRDGARSARDATIGAINEDARTVELAFSSEAEVERWWGIEVLSHDPASVKLERLRDGAPLLMDHKYSDQIGVIESVSLGADRRGRAVVRFGKSARAEEIFRDVVDGIRRNVSVGYTVRDAKKTGTRDSGEEIWTVTAWEPYEISIVSVPADPSVGVGRTLMSDTETAKPGSNTIHTEDNRGMSDNATAPATAAAPTDATVERTRATQILDLGAKYNLRELAEKAVRDGATVDEFRQRALDAINSRASRPLAAQTRDADIGLTDHEARQFSFVRAINALTNPADRRAQEAAAFEFEASTAAAAKRGKDSGNFVIPADVLTRALNTSTDGALSGNTGGYSIATTLLTSSFIDILRNRTTILQLGVTLGGLVGNVDIPKQTAASTAYWVGENQDATESELDLGQISMSPKTLASYSEITRKLLVQSSIDVEALVRADLAKGLALALDKAGYYGTGSDYQPTGIANHATFTQTFAATQPTFAELVAMETSIALANADVPSMAYVSNAAFRGAMKTSLKFPGVNGASQIWEPGNTVNGYRTEITNQIPTGDVFFGNFNDLIIGMWSGLELLVDPYSGSKSGRLRVVLFQDVDFALRRTASFVVGRH